MSPRKAFSFAINGGLNSVCAPAKWVNLRGDIVDFSGVEVLEAFALLRREPEFSCLTYKLA